MWLTVILPLLKKYWYVAVIIALILALGTAITASKVKIAGKNKEIVDLQESIDKMQVSNQVLYKNLEFHKEQLRLSNTFTNSDSLLGLVSNYQLYEDALLVLREVNKEYNSLFSN